MSMTITPRDVGDVTILECAGRMTLGEGSALLRDSIRQQLRLGRNRLILLVDGIAYFDSSGVGELVSGFTVVSNCGGALKLLSPSPRMRDCLQITKLYTVFEVFDDEAAAVESFNRPTFSFDCPVCRSRVRAYDRDGMVNREIECGICDLEFALAPVMPGSDRLGISALKLRSYYSEGVTLSAGQPFELRIAGRLDLFSSLPLKKVWRVIPAPCRLLIDLRLVTQIEPAGRDALLSLIAESGSAAKIALSLAGLSAENRAGFPIQPPFFESLDLALEALGDVSDTPRLSVALMKS